MRRLALAIVWLALGCSGPDSTEPSALTDATVTQSQRAPCLTPAAGSAGTHANSCQNIAGHVAGQIIGPTSQCAGGDPNVLTEVGTFTGLGGGTFVACITALEQKGNGSL